MSQTLSLVVHSTDDPPKDFRLTLMASTADEINDDKPGQTPQIMVSVSPVERTGDDEFWETLFDLEVHEAKLLQMALGLLLAHLEAAPA